MLGIDVLYHLKTLVQQGADDDCGMEEVAPRGPVVATSTQVRITMDAFRGGGNGMVYDGVAEVSEDFISQALTMSMARGEQCTLLQNASFQAVREAEECVFCLRSVLPDSWAGFRYSCRRSPKRVNGGASC